jgi:AraC-like DNA-binding protein
MLECDGVIARIISPEMVRAAQHFPIPILNYSGWLDDTGLATVRMDDLMAGRLCADYVMRKRFLRVATVQLAGADFNARRLAGFIERLTGAEITSLKLHSFPPGDDDVARFRAWIRGIKPPFALFITDHNPAQIFMDACVAEGLRIPADVAFLSPRNREDEESYPFTPALTHVVFDSNYCMSVAVRKLDELMSGQIKAMGVVEVPPKGLVERASSNTTPVDDPVMARIVDQLSTIDKTPVNLKALVDKLGMNRRTFDRNFRITMGMSAHEFITQCRCKLAVSILKSKSKLSLRQVAIRCQFTDARQMKTILCRVYGLKTFSRSALPDY